MTPLQIEILLHYYCHTNDYHDGDFGAPAIRAAIDGFVRDELLKLDEPDLARTCYVITERGRVYVEAIRAVPLPERRWVMPSSSPGYVVPNLHLPPGPTPDPLVGWRVT